MLSDLLLGNLRSCDHTAGFHIEAAPHGGSGSHSLGMCFLAPGAYQLHLCGVAAAKAGATDQEVQAHSRTAAAAPAVSLGTVCVCVQ
jgi:hypothetical protein